MVEEARLESVYTPKGYRGFESPSFREGGVEQRVTWFAPFFYLLKQKESTRTITNFLSNVQHVFFLSVTCYTIYFHNFAERKAKK